MEPAFGVYISAEYKLKDLSLILEFVHIKSLENINTVKLKEQWKAEAQAVISTSGQVALADKIILNKTDLVMPEQREQLKNEIRSVNIGAPIVETVKCLIPLDYILDIRAYSGSDHRFVWDANSMCIHLQPILPKVLIELAFQTCLRFKKKLESITNDVESNKYHVHIEKSVGTITLNVPGKVPKASVDLFLQKLLWEKAAHDSDKVTDIIRLKGVVSVEEDVRTLLVQAVYDTYDTVYTTHTNEEVCRFIFIGRYLNEKNLRSLLESCVCEARELDKR